MKGQKPWHTAPDVPTAADLDPLPAGRDLRGLLLAVLMRVLAAALGGLAGGATVLGLFG